jgi:IS30 family transposase
MFVEKGVLGMASETKQKRPWRRVTPELRREIIELVKSGMTPNQVSRKVGRSNNIVYGIIREMGGVFRAEEIESGFRLSVQEREEILLGLARGESIRQIARVLRRAASTVCREVNANGGRGGYRPWGAQTRARLSNAEAVDLLRINSDKGIAESWTELCTAGGNRLGAASDLEKAWGPWVD